MERCHAAIEVGRLPLEELLKLGVWNVGKFVAYIGPSSPGGGVVFYLGSVFEVFRRFCRNDCVSLPRWIDVDFAHEVSGYCYLRVITPDLRLKVLITLGKYPTWRQLLTMFEGRAVDTALTKHFGLVYSATTDTVHLVADSLPSFPCDILVKYYLALLSGGSGLEDSVHSALGSVDSKVGGVEVMREWLLNIGIDLPQGDLQLISSTPALLPESGKHKYRMFEAVGDAVITLELSELIASQSGTVEEYQNRRSVVTSNVALARVFSEKFPGGAVDCAAGVDLRGKVGAKALEAVVGAVYLGVGKVGVHKLLKVLSLFE